MRQDERTGQYTLNSDEARLFDALSTARYWVFRGLALFALVIGSGMYGCPTYNVWQQGLEGKSELAKAEYNRQIAVQEAQAKHAAATELAQAEIERAKGVAEANKIVADSLKGHEEYLRYLWIDNVAKGQNREVIYVPTEANLPILEASRNAVVK